ncbi:MAG TPA: hypothetical protein PLX23_11055 [Candidatus Hydrogenedens sp.]|nr:hypothetical protein [Candidatus Hydrogenedens sp.]
MKQTIVDRIYLVIMVISFIAVIGMIIYLHRGPYRKFLESRNELNQVHSQLQMIEKLKKEQEESLKTQEMLFDIINKRPANFDFFSYVNQLLKETQLTDRAKLDNYRARAGNSPRQPMVQIKLEGVSLKRFSDFLRRIYSDSYLVAVYKMDKLKPNQSGKGIDCELTLVTLK